MRCGRCRKALYCDANCQKQDFPFHKRVCVPPKMRLRELGDRFQWSGAFPGLGKEDFDVRIEGDVVAVRGAEDPSLVDEHIQLRDADLSTVEATFRDGHLIITVMRSVVIAAAPENAKVASAPAEVARHGTVDAWAPPPAVRPGNARDETSSSTPAGEADKDSGQAASPAAASGADGESALAKSLSKAGKYSYYYAHRDGVTGAPAYDAQRQCTLIANYSFCDEETCVKVFVPFDGAAALPETCVTLHEHSDNEVELNILSVDGESCHTLKLLLLKRITSASVKRRRDKLVLTLRKPQKAGEWATLTRKPWESVYEYS